MRIDYQKSLIAVASLTVILLLIAVVLPVGPRSDASRGEQERSSMVLEASLSSMDLSHMTLEPIEHFIPEATMVSRSLSDASLSSSNENELDASSDETNEPSNVQQSESQAEMVDSGEVVADNEKGAELEEDVDETRESIDEQEAEDTLEFRDADHTLYVDAGTLNLRAGPSTDQDILAKLSLGDKVHCIAEHDEWVRVEAGEHVGYLSREFTSQNMVFVPVEQTRYVEANRLNLRANPSSDAEILKTLEHNDPLTRTGVGDGWSKVTAACGTAGYVASSYLMVEKEVTESTASQEATEPEVVETSSQEGTGDEIALFKGVVDLEACSSHGYDGYLAVASVVLNRVESSRFPNTIEGVLTQRNQFSVLGRVDRSRTDYRDAVEKAVNDALAGKRNMPGYVLFFASYSGYDNNVARGGGFADLNVHARAYGNVWCYDPRDQ